MDLKVTKEHLRLTPPPAVTRLSEWHPITRLLRLCVTADERVSLGHG